MNKYFYNLAKAAADIANYYGSSDNNIKAEWIYSQWQHESGNFSSRLALENHNLGGLCQTNPNDSPQPDGDQYYMNFDTYEAYANYFGKYLRYYQEDGIYDARTLDEYITALKHGEYFGDCLESYLADCRKIANENFPE